MIKNAYSWQIWNRKKTSTAWQSIYQKARKKEIFLERNSDSFPLRIAKKAKMPTITPLSNIMVQVLVSRARTGKKKKQKQKRERENKKEARERKKLSFAANIIMHIESPKEYTDKPLKYQAK